MSFDRESFWAAVALARGVYAEVGAPSAPVLIVPTLLEYVKECTGLKEIRITGQPGLMPVLRGLVTRTKENATIRVDVTMNHCWTRFVACKELLQLAADTEDRFSRGAASQIYQAFAMRTPLHESASLSSEEFALFATWELLFPHRHRPVVPPPQTLPVAQKFEIPQFYVDLYYNTPYGLLSHRANLVLEEQETKLALVTAE